MSGSRTEDRIADLVRDLRPVRRIPRIGMVVAVAALLAMVSVAGLGALTGGAWPEFARFRDDLGYACVFFGLLVLMLGALVASLALAVPGRERTTGIGLALAGSGLALASAAVLAALVSGAAADSWAALVGSGPCMAKATLLATGPVVVCIAFLRNAASHQPRSSSALALAGGVALGAALVHATCAAGDPMHWLLGHVLPPLGAALVLALPLGALLVGLRRRSDRRSARPLDAR